MAELCVLGSQSLYFCLSRRAKDDRLSLWCYPLGDGTGWTRKRDAREWRTGMDTFMDKLAQKRNAQEIIRANAAAEAQKMEKLEKQVEAYEGILQEMRKVNTRSIENEHKLERLLEESLKKIEEAQPQSTGAEEGTQSLAEEIRETLTQTRSSMEEQLRQSDDLLHRENVKVYRNVQASLIEELGKQTQEWKELFATELKPGKRTGIYVLLVLILAGVAANLVIALLPYIM